MSPGLFIASRFYPFDDDMPPNPVVIDCTTLRDDDSDQAGAIEKLAHVIACLREDRYYNYNVVLVCDAGRNRSAVVAGWHLSCNDEPDPVGVIRRAREPALGRSGGALTNRKFVEYLEGP